MFNESQFINPASPWYIDGTVVRLKDSSLSIHLPVLAMDTVTDPAGDAAVSTAIIDVYSGIIITLGSAGNSQTLQSPTVTTAGRKFTVVTDDGNTTYTIEVNGITMSAGEAQRFVWDGSAWIAVTAVDADDITFTPAGDIAATDVQTAIEEVDTEKVPRIVSVDNEVVRFDGTGGDVQGYSSNAPTIDDDGLMTIPGISRLQNQQAFYGVSWDESANTYARTGALTGVAVGSSPGNAQLPIQAAMRRCILNDAGIVQYYLEPDNSYNRLGYAPSITGTDDVGTASKVSDVGVFTLAAAEYVGKYIHNTTDDTYALITAKDSNDVLSINADIMDITETFEICTAGIGYGGDGQVMVEIPLFYHRYSYVGTTHTWDISFVPLNGFSVHPTFVKNGEIVPCGYAGAYESSMYDASAGVMVPDASIETAYTITSGDKLCSLSGAYPKTNETRNEFRIMAAMRGDGWRQNNYDLASAWQLLYLVEYASFQSQAMIGTGRTMFSGGAWEAANQGNGKYIGQCGYSNLDGNATGGTNRASAADISAVNTDTDTSYHDYMSYRGIENIFGNVWKWIDGINISANTPYVCNDDSDFQDDTEEGYTALDVTMPAANGYQGTLFPQDRGFLPKTTGASTQIGDYYYQNISGWRVVRLGGHASVALHAGAFFVSAHDDSAYGYVYISGRLCR